MPIHWCSQVAFCVPPGGVGDGAVEGGGERTSSHRCGVRASWALKAFNVVQLQIKAERERERKELGLGNWKEWRIAPWVCVLGSSRPVCCALWVFFFPFSHFFPLSARCRPGPASCRRSRRWGGRCPAVPVPTLRSLRPRVSPGSAFGNGPGEKGAGRNGASPGEGPQRRRAEPRLLLFARVRAAPHAATFPPAHGGAV